MKRLFILFNFLLITSIICNAQKDSLVTIKKFNELKNQVDKLDLKIESVEKFKEEQKDIVLQTNQTINNQNSLISSFGIIYTIFTIFIALIAVGLPIITYQYSIKPSKQALKDLEENLDKKVADYLKETRQQQIKKSIEHLKGENVELKSQAISFLSFTQHEGFSDSELFDFYKLIKSGTLSDSHVGSVAYLLASRVNEYANDFFSDVKSLENNLIKSSAYQYIAKVGIQNFIKPLKLLISSKNALGEFLTLVTFTNMYSRKSAIAIFDNKELVDCLDTGTLKIIKPSLTNTLDNLKISMTDFEKTYLNEKIEKASV